MVGRPFEGALSFQSLSPRLTRVRDSCRRLAVLTLFAAPIISGSCSFGLGPCFYNWSGPPASPPLPYFLHRSLKHGRARCFKLAGASAAGRRIPMNIRQIPTPLEFRGVRRNLHGSSYLLGMIDRAAGRHGANICGLYRLRIPLVVGASWVGGRFVFTASQICGVCMDPHT